jgi:hypothetical protein
MTPLTSKPTDEDLLRQCLEPLWRDTRQEGGRVLGVHRQRFDQATSYAGSIVTVRLTGGAEVRLFLKDFGFSQLPKDGLDQRRWREVRVYRDLLAEAGLGTPGYYGSVWDGAEGRYWLLLEFVNGRLLRDLGPVEYALAAAGWLGRMHGYFARHPHRLRGCDFLACHDAAFFFSRAELALRAVAQISAPLAGRLAGLLKGYDRLVEVLAGQPPALVHGSYRPENLLVKGDPGPAAICPIDWELAALGSPLYDLAFLSDKFRQPKRERLRTAYREEAGKFPLPLPGEEEMRYVVDGYRLHKTLKSLSEAAEKKYPENKVAKLVEVVEGLRPLVL